MESIFNWQYTSHWYLKYLDDVEHPSPRWSGWWNYEVSHGFTILDGIKILKYGEFMRVTKLNSFTRKIHGSVQDLRWHLSAISAVKCLCQQLSSTNPQPPNACLKPETFRQPSFKMPTKGGETLNIWAYKAEDRAMVHGQHKSITGFGFELGNWSSPVKGCVPWCFTHGKPSNTDPPPFFRIHG